MSNHVSANAIRTAFSDAMSAMYRTEVPQYATLLEIVDAVNADCLAGGGNDPVCADPGRLSGERHGAIRLGSAEELQALSRIFAVMGMHPVGYYDLSVAGVPVHSTAFRPIDEEDLGCNPFRIFTSLLNLSLIDDDALRREAAAIIGRRRIVSDRALALTSQWEAENGLSEADASEFVQEVLNTFRWQREARVDIATYRRLHAAHPLIADVVSFAGPHINHLTPRTLDIDATQQRMADCGLAIKDVIEGPPRRAVPILLRQTSFRALEEPVLFPGPDGTVQGAHTARFGEIEQRGVALTHRGRTLYDRLLSEARGSTGPGSSAERLTAAFAAFPDDPKSLRDDGLAYFRYRATDRGARVARAGETSGKSLAEALDAGWVTAEPILYEDFLPVSAAGIFQSNLSGLDQTTYTATASQDAFEQALGRPVLDPFELYAAAEAESRAATQTSLALSD